MAVTEDVFAAYAQMDRRERYLSEDLPTGKVLSMEQLAEDGVLPDYVGAETAPSAEDCVLARESEREREELTSLLLAALIALEDRDRQLITALFYDRLSTREYARRIGVTQRAVIKRRDRILRDMKNILKICGVRVFTQPLFREDSERGKYLPLRCSLKSAYQQCG